MFQLWNQKSSKMTLWKRLHNLIELSKIEISPDTKEQISNIISPERPRQAQIIKMKTKEQIISDLINDK